MIELTLEEIHCVEHEMLEYIDKFCSDNDLTYYLAYGSLLGAIRHNGFIPWDDDSDILMPRDDFDKFVSIWSSKSTILDYDIIIPCQVGYSFGWAKIINTNVLSVEPDLSLPSSYGLSIDIFPLDYDCGVFQDKIIRLQNAARGLERRNNPVHIENDNPLKVAAKSILKLTPDMFCNYRAQRFLLNFFKEDLNRVVNHFSPYGYLKDSYPSNYFGTPIRHDFDGINLNIPEEPECILRQLYGDNWHVPVVAKRHGIFYKRDYKDSEDI